MARKCNWGRRAFVCMFLIYFLAVATYFVVGSVYGRRCGTVFLDLNIESASLDYPNGSKIGEWTLGISVKNNNKCNAIFYNVFKGYVSQEAAGICIYTQRMGAIDSMIQLPLNKTLVVVNPKGWRMIDNQRVGAGYINVTLQTEFNLKIRPKINLVAVAANHEMIFVCRNVPVWFHGRGAIMSGAPVPCQHPSGFHRFYRSTYGCVYQKY